MTSTLSVYLEGLSFWSPRLPSWEVARGVIRGEREIPQDPVSRPQTSLLPPTERRRIPDTVAVALEVAVRACEASTRDRALLPAVFASTHGDTPISDYMCSTLASAPTLISPTKFHNSVHNAASGYYSIAVQSHYAVTSLCAFDHTAVAALLEAAVQTTTESSPVLMVSYDLPYPFPLSEARPTVDAWAISLVLAPTAGPGALQLLIGDAAEESAQTALADPTLEHARRGNPTARLLPLLAALAQRQSAQVMLPQSDRRVLSIEVRAG